MKRLCSLYAKHGNLVHSDASDWHQSQHKSEKHLESHLEVIQGHAFWDHWKADEGLRIPVILWALKLEISKEMSDHLRFREPHCHSAPPL